MEYTKKELLNIYNNSILNKLNNPELSNFKNQLHLVCSNANFEAIDLEILIFLLNNLNSEKVKMIDEENLFSSIVIPEGVTTIDFNAFEYNQLTSVTLPNSLITIGIQAFAYNLLENITIPNNVTTIKTNAFRFNDLVGIELPNSVTFIGPRAFEYNNILQDDATIDNNSINVTIDIDAFSHNGIDGNTTITPIFLRD